MDTKKIKKLIREVIENLDDKLGKTFWFEYHCFESVASCDYKLWLRSHQKVKVLARGQDDHDEFPDEPKVYTVQFDDGFKYDVYDDELMNSPEEFYRPDPPKSKKQIKESIGKMFDQENKPSIFNRTIYRLPTPEELAEFENFNLSADEVYNGFYYTMVGRGMLNMSNKKMIADGIQMLINMYPKNQEYKKALEKVKKEKSIFREGKEDDSEPEFDKDKFIRDKIDKINAPQTCEDMMNYARFQFGMGGFIPFNPPDPLRSAFKKKFEELRQIDPENFSKLEHMYSKVSGEYKPTPDLPPGAVY